MKRLLSLGLFIAVVYFFVLPQITAFSKLLNTPIGF
jgi:hypothetical protein